VTAAANVIPEEEVERLREAKQAPRTFQDEDGNEVEPLEFARRKLRLPALRRVVKRARRDAIYDLELEDGTADGMCVPVGSSRDLMDPRKVEAVVADATDIGIPYYGAKLFRPVANALLSIAELEDTGSTPENLTRAWLAAFAMPADASWAEAVDLKDPEQKARAVREGSVFRAADGCLYVYSRAFEAHVRHFQRVPTGGEKDLTARLARLGFAQTRLSVPRRRGDEKEPPKRRFWRSPPRFDPHEDI